VLWFRPEIIRTVTWAGNPEKPVQASEGGLRLNPRKSFAAWQEIVQRRSLPWQGVDAEAAQRLRISMLEVVLRRLDEVMREREEARAHKDFLMAELDHRVKNTIATVQSIVRYCSANTDSLDAFTVSIQDRLQAMASAHGMLIENRWEGGELNAIITEQLRPFGVGTRVKVTGPKLMLRPKAALSFSLAMHELATNASKYGALSVPAGWIELDWQAHSKDGERWLTFRWVERGGPPVTPPSRRGFGRLLLERSLAFDVDGKVDLDFRPEGLTCTAIIPFEQIVEQEYEQE
jgi:chemotaxis family two-component system sensor kinase Cph1